MNFFSAPPRVVFGHARCSLGRATAFVGLLAALALPASATHAQTLMDFQSQIQAATEALQQGATANDGSEGTSLAPDAPPRADGDVESEDGSSEDRGAQTAGSTGDEVLVGEFSQPSSIEMDYSQRTGRQLRQFGYGTFRRGSRAALAAGEIGPNYRLGIGDELVVTLRGRISRTISVVVNRDGDIILPELPPMKAIGLTVSQLRQQVGDEVSRSMVGAQAFISVGSVRLISVSVVGEVRRPGLRSVHSLSTIIDAVAAAGGIRKSGSLRRIEVVRADGSRLPIDLYRFLNGAGIEAQVNLQDGDRIVVPPVGPTVAVDGDVGRPAIFETAPGQSSMSIPEALTLAGGPLRPAGNRFMQIEFEPSGVQSVKTVSGQSGVLRRGEILQVFIDRNAVGGTVSVEGAVSTPGVRAIDSKGSLSKILSNIDLLTGSPYLPFAVVLTRDPITLLPRFLPVDLNMVLTGAGDVALSSGDRVLIIGAEDVAFLSSPAVAGALSGGAVRNCTAVEYLRNVTRRTQAESFLSARQFLSQIGRGGATIVEGERVERGGCPTLFDQYPTLMPILLENVTAVTGDVRNPGLYPIVQPVSLRLVLAAAGGLGRSADISQVEITRYDAGFAAQSADVRRERYDLEKVSVDSVMVRPGDMVRIATRVTTRERGLVTIRGEVLRPGAYDIRRGERLSEVIARAGGLTAEAYPFGAIFTRDRVRELERQANQRTAQELQKGIVSLLARQAQRSTDNGVGTSIGPLRELAADISGVTPYGRVVVEADPAVLAARPELDVVLEPGDELAIPKRPNYVLLVGEVLNPGAQQFRSGRTPQEYIDLAGGLALDSDEDRIFIVLPNGAAEPITIGSWSQSPTAVPPGSMIVVPRDLAPFDFLAITGDVTRILGSLALTAASLNAISN